MKREGPRNTEIQDGDIIVATIEGRWRLLHIC
jgi:hypothetical protein